EVINHLNHAKDDHAPVRQPGVALKSSVVEDLIRFIDQKTNPLVVIDVSPQMSACDCVVEEQPPVHRDVKEWQTVGAAIFADGGQAAGETRPQELLRLFLGHAAVNAAEVWRTTHFAKPCPSVMLSVGTRKWTAGKIRFATFYQTSG